MHCFSTYPMEVKNANLKTIDSLRKRFDCNVGYSGHESGLAVSFAAVGHGITLERHITLDRAFMVLINCIFGAKRDAISNQNN